MKLIVAVKGSSTSGNRGHAGRPGKIGGSAPKQAGPAVANDNIAQPKYNRLDDMPLYKKDYTVDQLYDIDTAGTGEDLAMKLILQEQGYDGKPDVISKEEMDARVAAGETELFRGVSDIRPGKADEYAEQFRSGELYAGQGGIGSGTYASTNVTLANRFAGYETHLDRGTVMRMTIKPGARMIDADKLSDMVNRDVEQHNQDMDKAQSKLYSDRNLTKEQFQAERDRLDLETLKYRKLLAEDLGRFAASRGYDVIVAKANSYGQIHVVINRTAVRVQATNLEPPSELMEIV